jgi:hypothetical protein
MPFDEIFNMAIVNIKKFTLIAEGHYANGEYYDAARVLQVVSTLANQANETAQFANAQPKPK